jgi:hypothetical protein
VSGVSTSKEVDSGPPRGGHPRGRRGGDHGPDRARTIADRTAIAPARSPIANFTSPREVRSALVTTPTAAQKFARDPHLEFPQYRRESLPIFVSGSDIVDRD